VEKTNIRIIIFPKYGSNNAESFGIVYRECGVPSPKNIINNGIYNNIRIGNGSQNNTPYSGQETYFFPEYYLSDSGSGCSLRNWINELM